MVSALRLKSSKSALAITSAEIITKWCNCCLVSKFIYCPVVLIHLFLLFRKASGSLNYQKVTEEETFVFIDIYNKIK